LTPATGKKGRKIKVALRHSRLISAAPEMPLSSVQSLLTHIQIPTAIDGVQPLTAATEKTTALPQTAFTYQLTSRHFPQTDAFNVTGWTLKKCVKSA